MKIVDPYKASYGVSDPIYAMTQLAQTTMRSEIGKLTLDENNKGVIASLYVPKIRIVRVRALNTGQQGGYGRGDSVEVRLSAEDHATAPNSDTKDDASPNPTGCSSKRTSVATGS